MFKDKAIKKGIIASLIASIIFLIFLQPVLKIIWNFLNRTSIKLYTNYLDSIYKVAAQGHRNDIDFFFFALMLSLLLSTFLILIFVVKAQRRPERIEKIFIVGNRPHLPKLELREEWYLRLLYKLIRFSKSGQYIKMLIVIAICYLIIGSSLLFKTYADFSLNVIFNQKLNVVSPYLSEFQEEELVSKWALMTSKKDYLYIKQIIDSAVIKNNINLPKNLMK